MLKSADGVMLSVEEWGNPSGPPILFIHGYCQSSLAWSRQVKSELTAEFRLVTFDLRGHGNSEKPLTPESYKESRRWAGDIDAILQQLGLRKPALVGWSYGGRVINDYLAGHGDGALAGIVYVDAVTTGKPGVYGEAAKAPGMSSEDLETRTAATRTFAAACFKQQPAPGEMAAVLASNMQTPPHVRRFLGGRPAAYDEVLKKIAVPVLVVQGRDDEIILPAMSEHTLSMVKHAKAAFYDGVGHSPFYEAAVRFNADLAAFVRSLRR